MDALGNQGSDGLARDFLGNQRFSLENVLGEGAFGVVYQAFDRLYETRVALKVLKQPVHGDAVRRFKREFRAMVDIHHPHLVRYRELFEEGGRWFLTMECVCGPSLVEAVRSARHGPGAHTDFERLRLHLGQLHRGIVRLHDAGVVHRDIKPSNIRVVDSRAVLIDFGLALELERADATRTAQVGTAQYMAPEQRSGTGVGPLADYYALGAVLYECLTGRAPFVGEPYQVLVDKELRAPVPPVLLAEEVPEDLNALCLALLSVDPEARWGGVAALSGACSANEPRLSAAVCAETAWLGRGDARAVLARAVEGGEARVVSISGPAGVGKSVLLRAAARLARAERPDALVVTSRVDGRESMPWAGVDALVDALAALAEHGAAAEPCSAGIVFAPARVEVGAAPLKAALSKLAAQRRVVWLVEDADRVCAQSARLVAELLSGTDAPPCVVITAASSPEARGAGPSVQRVIEAREDVQRLVLGPLEESAAAELARHGLSTLGGDPSLAAAIAREGQGEPWLITWLVQDAVARRVARVLSAGEVLRARIESLSPAARSLLAWLAVAGTPLALEVLGALPDPNGWQTALDALQAAELARLERMSEGLAATIVHARVRALMLAALDDHALRGMHDRLGDALARSGGDAESTARHWIAAGRAHDAAVRARRAAGAALAEGRAEDAVRLTELALNHGTGTPSERVECSVIRAEGLSAAGRAQEAAELFAHLADGAEGEHALSLRQRAAWEWFEADAGEQALATCLSLARDLDVDLPPESGRRWSLRGSLLPPWLRGPRAERDGESPVRGRVRVDVLYRLAFTYVRTDLRKSAWFQQQHLASAADCGEPCRLARALAFDAWMRRDGARRSPAPARAEALAKSSGDALARAWVELAKGHALYEGGDLAEAMQHAERARAWLGELKWGVAPELREVLRLRDRCCLETGAWRALVGGPLAYWGYLVQGEAARALDAVGAPVGPADLAGLDGFERWVARADVDLYLGAQGVHDRVMAAWPDLERTWSVGGPALPRYAYALRARAALADADGGNGAGRLLADARLAVRVLSKQSTRASRALAALYQAGVLERMGERASARRLLAEATTLGEQAGMRPIAEAARRRAGVLLGGAEGEALIEEADAWSRAQGVVEPARLVAVLCGVRVAS